MEYLKSYIGNIWQAEKGNVATEYAIVLPIFLTMIMGGFELGHIFLVNSALEGALIQSTRSAMNGSLPTGYASRDQYIEDLVRKSLKGVGIEDGVSVSMRVYESFKNIGEAEPFVDQNGNHEYDPGECFTDINDSLVWDADMGSQGAGGSENIMVMTIEVGLPFLTGFMTHVLGDKNGVNLTGTTVIRNEPFGGVSWEPSRNVLCS